MLNPIGDRSVDENAMLAFTISACDGTHLVTFLVTVHGVRNLGDSEANHRARGECEFGACPGGG